MNGKITFIPVASGKGGVGKSIFSANLSIALAKLGFKTVAVDLDLGGSNLHTYLGMANKYSGIGDYLKSKECNFEELLIDTRVENLRFLPGDGRTPFMANIPFDQRLQLIHKLQNIDAKYVILDLGAGSSFNTLNFFGLAHRGIIVTTFETPSIMNFFMFLRNFIFRVISSVVRHDKRIFNFIVDDFRQTMADDPLTAQMIIKKIEDRNPQLAAKVKKVCKYFRPRIIFNMGEHPQDLKLINKINNTIKQSLSMEAEYFGFVFYDDNVRLSCRQKQVLMLNYPDSIATMCIKDIARRTSKYWEKNIDKSAIRLIEDTKKKYTLWFGTNFD